MTDVITPGERYYNDLVVRPRRVTISCERTRRGRRKRRTQKRDGKSSEYTELIESSQFMKVLRFSFQLQKDVYYRVTFEFSECRNNRLL